MENRREYEAAIENARVWVLLEDYTAPAPKHQIDTNHIHQYVEVFVCCKGALHFELYKNEQESQIAAIAENDCLLIPIEYSHHLLSVDERAEWYSFGFHVQHIKRRGTSGLYEQLSMLKKMDAPCRIADQNRFCEETRRLLCSEYTKGSCLPALQITALLSLLLQKNGAAVISSSSDTLWMKNGNSQFTVLEHILAARYMEKLSYRTVAADLHISERQLSRIIQKRYQTTLHKLLTEKRLEAAHRMMKSGERDLFAIADAVGFANRMAFYKAFAQKYGSSPRQFCESIDRHDKQ